MHAKSGPSISFYSNNLNQRRLSAQQDFHLLATYVPKFKRLSTLRSSRRASLLHVRRPTASPRRRSRCARRLVWRPARVLRYVAHISRPTPLTYASLCACPLPYQVNASTRPPSPSPPAFVRAARRGTSSMPLSSRPAPCPRWRAWASRRAWASWPSPPWPPAPSSASSLPPQAPAPPPSQSRCTSRRLPLLSRSSSPPWRASSRRRSPCSCAPAAGRMGRSRARSSAAAASRNREAIAAAPPCPAAPHHYTRCARRDVFHLVLCLRPTRPPRRGVRGWR